MKGFPNETTEMTRYASKRTPAQRRIHSRVNLGRLLPFGCSLPKSYFSLRLHDHADTLLPSRERMAAASFRIREMSPSRFAGHAVLK